MRILVLLAFIVAALLSCKNEPYNDPSLVISGVRRKNGALDSGSFSYKYKEGNLYTFTSSKTGSIMTFTYVDGQLVSLLDTTASYQKSTTFFGWGSSSVTDSTILITDTLSSLYSVRTVNYNELNKPSNIDIKFFTNEGIVEQTADLTWQDGNVVRLITKNFNTGVTRDLSIEYDGEPGAYGDGIDYVYTLSLGKLYWLSRSNPVLFTDASGATKLVYTFNKFGYPATFKNEANTTSTVSYFSSGTNE